LPTKVAPGISGGGAMLRETVEQEISSNDALAIHAPRSHQAACSLLR
jgi:predicted neutral ceramidase superfamily lipid hydrolase